VGGYICWCILVYSRCIRYICWICSCNYYFREIYVRWRKTIASGPMWGNLGTHWSCTLLGCLAAALIPVPFAFFKWGLRIRSISRFAGHKTLADGAENASEEFLEPA
jgi:hypothetical protein